jgi:CDP-diglyceride synthetase
MCGILWGLGVFCMTWFILLRKGESTSKTFLGRAYFGYSISPRGSVIGFAWGFCDGLISGALLAWIYNSIAAAIMK